jgi:hypothetical protein
LKSTAVILWSTPCLLYTPPKKISIGVKSGNYGNPALSMHIPGKVLSRNFQTIKPQHGRVPSCYDTIHERTSLTCWTTYNSSISK